MRSKGADGGGGGAAEAPRGAAPPPASPAVVGDAPLAPLLAAQRARFLCRLLELGVKRAPLSLPKAPPAPPPPSPPSPPRAVAPPEQRPPPPAAAAAAAAERPEAPQQPGGAAEDGSRAAQSASGDAAAAVKDSGAPLPPPPPEERAPVRVRAPADAPKRAQSGGARDAPARRVSFKVRGPSAASRRSRMVEARVVLNSNTVAALTTKFQALISERGSGAGGAGGAGGAAEAGAGARAADGARRSTLARRGVRLPACDAKARVARKSSSGARRGAAAASASASAVAAAAAAVAASAAGGVARADDAQGPHAAPTLPVLPTPRPALLGARSGSVRAAIQIFEGGAAARTGCARPAKPASAHASALSLAPSPSPTPAEEPVAQGPGADSAPRPVGPGPPQVAELPPPAPLPRAPSPSALSQRAPSPSALPLLAPPPRSTSPRAPSPRVPPRAPSPRAPSPRVSSPASLLITSTTTIITTTTATTSTAGKSSTAAARDEQPDVQRSSLTQDKSQSKEEAANPAVSSTSLDGVQSGKEAGSCRAQEETDAYRSLMGSMKPNASFLWRSKDGPASPTLSLPPAAAPPPSPPPLPERPAPGTYERVWASPALAAAAAEAEEEEEEAIYDDVQPAPRACPPEGDDTYAELRPADAESAYDDVGTVGRAAPPPPPLRADVEDGYEYCGETEPYDDCADAPPAGSQGAAGGVAPAGEPHLDEEDIYDDVKSLNTLRVTSDETTSISNCYESIYGGGGGGCGGAAGARAARRGGSSASSSSGSACGGGGGGRRSANASSCDQSNSLYGVGGSICGSVAPSQASTASGGCGGDDGSSAAWAYQPLAGPPRSETSDEWMDVEASDSEPDRPRRALLVLQERSRNRKSPSWSRKVRNQWSKSRSQNNSDIFVTSSSILYLGDLKSKYTQNQETLPIYSNFGFVALRSILHIGESHEIQEVTWYAEKEGGDISTDSEDHNYETLDNVTCQNNGSICDNEDSDSFESDISEANCYTKSPSQNDLEVGDKRLPDPPASQNIYGISRIAEAAGKKMLEFGRSLRKIRTKHTTGSERLIPNETGTTSVNKTAVSQQSKEREPKLSVSSLSPSTIQKVQSTGNLSGRKTWTLRKFKRSMSTSASAPSTSTFYLSSPVESNKGSGDIPSSNGHNHSPDLKTENKLNSDVDTARLANNISLGKLRPLLASSRRGSAAVRPNSPPPLPPTHPDSGKKPVRRDKDMSSTSWYTECGLFDRPNEISKRIDKPISNSWYAAVGLWGSSPDNPGYECLADQDSSTSPDVNESTCIQEANRQTQSCFPDEPLYQFYIGCVAEMAQCDAENDFDSDGYEEIGNKTPKIPTRPSAMELIQPKEGQHRTLWCEIPEVLSSQVLSTLSPHQKKLQEAKFEIITSEASYMNSLNVLEHHFMSSCDLNDDSILTRNDRRILFGNVLPVKKCSEMFLSDLEKCWQENILLHGICDTIFHHATNYFNVYVRYCSNQIYLDRTLRRLKERHCRFAEVLTQLEASPKCQLLSLHSFLMLPMQRITRLPLLIDAVLTRLDPSDDEYRSCELALATLNKVVQDCNEGARHMERMEQILILSRQIEFPREVKPVPIISSSRYLVRSGELIQLVWRGDDAKLTFGKKFSKVSLHIFLFTDLLVITKRKSEECFAVVDHCPRNLVQISSAEGMPHLPVKFSADSGRNLMLLTMLQNHEKKTVEMILSCPLESDRQRWLEAVSQPTSDNPDERVYEEWDCPQVTAIHPYTASQPDELSLDVSDVVNVLCKMIDGWYQGERIRDGERGWFPGNYTVEIGSAHVRARNLKQRYRLLALSGNFLESQRKEKLYK